MAVGQYRCLGPVQHLGNKFSKGFILTIKTGFMDHEKIKELRQKIIQKFLDVELIEKHLDVLIFHLTTTSMDYSEIFQNLSEIKDEMEIEDYNFSQMSLDRIFLNIGKYETPFTQEEAIQIAKEEGKWKEDEMNERKTKINEDLKKIERMKKKARKMGRKIARRLAKKQQEEFDQKQLEELKRMEEEKLEMERRVDEEIAKTEQKSGLQGWLKSHIRVRSKRSLAKKLDKKKLKIREKIEEESKSNKYQNTIKEKRNIEHFNRRPIYVVKSNLSSDESSDSDSSDYDSGNEPNLDETNELDDLLSQFNTKLDLKS